MHSPNKLLYPMLLVAAFSVTAFSLVGIATMTGSVPSAHSEVVDAATSKARSNDASLARPGTTRTAGAQAVGACANCAVVESVRIVERKGSGSGAGAVAGGLTGAVVGSQIGGGNGRTAMAVLGGVGGAYVGNEIEKNVKKTQAYQIKLRMDDGSIRVMTVTSPPDVASGDKVRLENGTVVRRG